jgi:hypothetical protein
MLVSRGGLFMLHRFKTVSFGLIVRSAAIVWRLLYRVTLRSYAAQMSYGYGAVRLPGISHTGACSCTELPRHQEIAAGGLRTYQSCWSFA